MSCSLASYLSKRLLGSGRQVDSRSCSTVMFRSATICTASARDVMENTVCLSFCFIASCLYGLSSYRAENAVCPHYKDQLQLYIGPRKQCLLISCDFNHLKSAADFSKSYQYKVPRNFVRC